MNNYSDKKMLRWAVVGGGNGGQAMAGHLALMGFPVKLYDIFTEKIEAIKKQGGIKVEGVVQGLGKVDLATNSIDEVLDGADIVMVVVPATAHRELAKACAPYLKDNQTVVINPGSTGGALEFRQVLLEEGCKAQITIAETQTLIYACRSERHGQSRILGIKNHVKVAALPANRTKKVVELLNQAFPQFEAAENVFVTSLENLNSIVHPAPTMLNTARIDSGCDFLYYFDGITPTIGSFLEELDTERINVGRALGLNLISGREWYKILYNVDAPTLYEAIQKNKAYKDIKGPKSLKVRYIFEDVPMGLVPIVSLGKMLGVPVPKMETVVRLAECLFGDDLTKNARTVETLGVSGMSSEEIIRFVETGQLM